MTGHEYLVDESGAAPLLRKVDEVTGALERLAEVLASEEDLSVHLERMCQQAVRAIGQADMASVSLLRDGEVVTAAATDERAVEIDRAQYSAGGGAVSGGCEDGAGREGDRGRGRG